MGLAMMCSMILSTAALSSVYLDDDPDLAVTVIPHSMFFILSSANPYPVWATTMVSWQSKTESKAVDRYISASSSASSASETTQVNYNPNLYSLRHVVQ